MVSSKRLRNLDIVINAIRLESTNIEDIRFCRRSNSVRKIAYVGIKIFDG